MKTLLLCLISISTFAQTHIKITEGATISTPQEGDIWYDGNWHKVKTFPDTIHNCIIEYFVVDTFSVLYTYENSHNVVVVEKRTELCDVICDTKIVDTTVIDGETYYIKERFIKDIILTHPNRYRMDHKNKFDIDHEVYELYHWNGKYVEDFSMTEMILAENTHKKYHLSKIVKHETHRTP